MNSIKNVPARVLSRRPGHSLEAEREQFDKTQASADAGRAGGGGAGALGALGPARTVAGSAARAAQVTGSRSAAGAGLRGCGRGPGAHGRAGPGAP